MKTITVALITSRFNPHFDWFLDSLRRTDLDAIRAVVIVDTRREERTDLLLPEGVLHVDPMPSVWQGKHRVLKQEWWAAASARNAAFCHCNTDWIWCLDDRSVILHGAAEAIQQAMNEDYAVCGSYEKRTGMFVHDGIINAPGMTVGRDHRETYCNQRRFATPFRCPGEWMFGCNFAMPIEWALDVNGQDEMTNGIGMDDIIFGLQLANAGRTIKFDPRLKIIEDRTEGETGPVMRREDKGVSPADKSHALLAKLRGLKRSTNTFNLAAVRAATLRGEPYPVPIGPTEDWFDGQKIIDFI